MTDIIRRLRNNNNTIIRSADWQLHRLHELGAAKSAMQTDISDILELSETEINRIYEEVISAGYAHDQKLYEKVGADFIPYEDNKELQQLIEAVKQQTRGEFANITQSLGFAIKGSDGKVVFKEAAKYYQDTLDAAALDIVSGAFDYNTVLRRTVKELTNSGLRTVDYASGRNNRVDVAACRAVMTGINQVTAKINDANAVALGTDTFEVSWHSGARPSHQVWQGKVYTFTELQTICGLGTGPGLCGWNCYHDYSPFIPGMSERTYTDEELDQLNKEENIPREYNGQKYTKYEALQRQRKLETVMRSQRQEIHLLKEGGADENDIIAARCRYRVTSGEYTRFSKAMGLSQERERVTVDGLGNIGAGKYTKQKKRDIINILPNAENVIIPSAKFTEYALNPFKDPDKAVAFKKALGYDLSTAEQLINNIKTNINKFNAVEKPDNGYGKRFEVLLTLEGINGRQANVKTAWIIDKNTGETRMTSVYVTNKKFREGSK